MKISHDFKQQLFSRVPSHLASKVSLLLIAFLWLAQILVSNQLSTSGVKLSQVEKQISDLANQNKNLESQLLEYNSIDNLNQQAQELGFDGVQRRLVIKLTPDLAMSR